MAVTRSQLLLNGHARYGAPFVRVGASALVATLPLGYALHGAPFVSTGDDAELPCSAYPRGEEVPVGGYPPITEALVSAGAEVYGFFSRSPEVVDTVFPAGGGDASFFTRVWVKRPHSPGEASGTLLEYRSGVASIKVNIGLSTTFTVTYTDGTTTVTDTPAEGLPTGGSSIQFPDGWTPLTLHYNQGSSLLKFYVGNALASSLDASALTVPAADTSRLLSLFVAADGTGSLDAGAMGLSTFPGDITVGEVEALNAEGPSFDHGNPTGVWDGTKIPDTFYREGPVRITVPGYDKRESKREYPAGEEAYYPPGEEPPSLSTGDLPTVPDPGIAPGAYYVPNAAVVDCQDRGKDLVLVPRMEEEADGGLPITSFPRLELEAHFTTHDDRRPSIEIGSEGGYFLELYVDQDVFPEGEEFVVQFRSGMTLYPDTQPGAYSSVPGNPYACTRTRGGRALRFTSPALPHGYGIDAWYDVVVTGDSIGTLIVESAVNVLPMQVSMEIMSVRNLPNSVYRPWGGQGPFTGTNEITEE